MELIICTDERGGMAFNKRRVSKDTEIMNRVEQIAKVVILGGVYFMFTRINIKE